MRRSIKRLLLYLLWATGAFALARRLTRRGLRILCYHGGSFADEHVFMPGLFMRPATFRDRLRYLARHRYPVLGLQEALERLARNDLPPCATVLTVDDGFVSTLHDAPGPLREYSFPATVYVTSYHAVKETPIFRLVVQYMFWKTRTRALDSPCPVAHAPGPQSLESAEQKHRVCWEIIRHAETRLTDEERCQLARELGQRLGVDYDAVAASRRFHVVTAEEVRRMAAMGIDIQLHTHRHRFPEDEAAAAREIADNRTALSALVGRPLVHFCYPSGVWSPRHWPVLEQQGVTSATTCDPGLNYPETPRLALRRFVDREDLSAIEFAAEVCGLAEWLRLLKARVKRLLAFGNAGKQTDLKAGYV